MIPVADRFETNYIEILGSSEKKNKKVFSKFIRSRKSNHIIEIKDYVNNAFGPSDFALNDIVTNS